VQAIEADMQRLDADYKAGLVGLDDYYQRRMTLIRNQVAAEVALLEKQKIPGLPKSKATEIDTAIADRRAAGELKVTAEVDRQTEAYRRMATAQREGDVSDVLDADAAAVAELTIRYEDGLISIREFYAERRRLSAEAAESEADKLEIEFAEANPEDQEDIFNRIVALRRRAAAELTALDREEVVSTRDALNMQLTLRADYLEAVAAGHEEGIDKIRAQGDAELAVIEAKYARLIEDVKKSHSDQLTEEEEFQRKKKAIEDLYSAKTTEKSKVVVKTEKDVLTEKFTYAKTISANIGQTFSDLYELSGKKIKAFFYIQKAAAVAEAIMNTAIGVTNALSIKPAFLALPMAATVAAMGAAQVALILASTLKGMWKGGPVTSGSGTKDDVPAMLTRGEYVQPAPTVRYYGTEVMEAIRRRIIPKDILKGFGFFPVARPQFAFVGGGAVSGGGMSNTSNTVSVGPINVNDGNNRLAGRLREEIEDTVIRVLREQLA
jgi:hypothetical protein